MRIFFTVIFVVCFTTVVSAQSQEKIYASMILNFARGIQWPGAFKTDNFIIGIFEYPPLANEVQMATEIAKVSGKKVEVREFTDAKQVTDCHLLFVPAYKAKAVPEILELIGKKPTLVVTNKNNLAKITGGINLVLINGRLQYEINSKSLESKGLKISSAIKSLGVIVE